MGTHSGLEDVDDLIADLEDGLNHLRPVTYFEFRIKQNRSAEEISYCTVLIPLLRFHSGVVLASLFVVFSVSKALSLNRWVRF